ncbi:MAG: pantoate--beta-alanine ligase [Saprospiraceae bacterium]|nr:pantoate--beta-alanine ligase [Saprospiraceae bacterium]
MLVFVDVSTITDWLQSLKKSGKSIGFVPTMGALHSGHISLIEASRSNTDITVCSIFVNPTQFNDPTDLAKYPRTYEADCKLLISGKCDVLFYPGIHEIYPENKPEIKVDLNGLDSVMEGTHRPGHFKGVVQVVHRLLDIVKPDKLYMGQKDFQQFTIIEHMIKSLQLPVELVVCPIAREPHGLAMSSRNERLSKEGRQKAGQIFTILSKSISLRQSQGPKQIARALLEELNHEPFKPEYVEIVDRYSLRPIDSWQAEGTQVICTAVWLEGVRLIDNIILN